ncbi:vitamin K epoxide reductase family protein [uncultured Dokdonia sp.]|uniref:vitamin K epoxide reductase family protein n=1 Tax=uncultured Dokdonia sp. TaxID=575653 RepID=UPI002639B172|nr:vitamin K epoxide reductase family protein [uncultured Dokdonia sp.]
MTEEISFNNVFHYLEKEFITFDKEEFLFQIQSHPNYPTVLSISDTLTFFNIDNGALRIDASQIDLLPDQFMALLKEANNETQLYFIQKEGDKYVTIKDKIPYEIDRQTLESRWQDLIFLIEKPDLESTPTIKKGKTLEVLSITCLILFLLLYFNSNQTISTLLFLLFPSIGILFSIAALKDLFGTKSKLINQFCNITTSTNCTTVVSSTKWKIFDVVNFSDLSILFFSSQLFGLVLFLLSGNFLEYFAIQKILLITSIPVILLSLYYQKFVEKKWCPICLVIASIVILEIGYLFLFVNTSIDVPIKSFFIYTYIILATITLWMILKKTLSKQKVLKEFQIHANRLLRNYTVFKNTLVSTPKIEIPPSIGIILGNRESHLQITIITNPFCGHCKEVHEIVHSILDKHGDQIQVKMLFKTAFELDNEETRRFFQILMTLYLEHGEKAFTDALNDFFESKNVESWNETYQSSIQNEKVDHLYSEMNDWCIENQINYTPELFINGFRYPSEYEKEYLAFYINDLIEDTNF